MNSKSTSIKKLATILRAARNEHQLSYGQLAERTGLSKATIFRLEEGGSQQPDLRVLQQLAEALDLSVVDLYAAAGYQPPYFLPR